MRSRGNPLLVYVKDGGKSCIRLSPHVRSSLQMEHERTSCVTDLLGCWGAIQLEKKSSRKSSRKNFILKSYNKKIKLDFRDDFREDFFFNWIGPQIYLIITWMNIMVLWSYGVNQFSKFCTTWQHFFHDALFWIVSKPKTSYQSLLRPQLFAFWVSFNQELI